MLRDNVRRYIALRRSLGFRLNDTARRLTSLARYAEDKGERYIRVQTAVAWAGAAPTPDSRYRRLQDAIGFARFLHAEDQAHEIPPSGVFTSHRNGLVPYIFTPDDLARLLDAAAERQSRETCPARRQIFVMLFGLIAATGLRISEAMKLRFVDILPDGVLHIRKTKFGKSRLVPLHQSVWDQLESYLVLRRAVTAESDHVFLSKMRKPLHYDKVHRAFHDILCLADIAPGRVRRPRIHDLRHTFATRVLEQCGDGRDAIAKHAVALMTYMGHSNPAHSYCYLQRTPELMAGMATMAETLVANRGIGNGATSVANGEAGR